MIYDELKDMGFCAHDEKGLLITQLQINPLSKNYLLQHGNLKPTRPTTQSSVNQKEKDKKIGAKKKVLFLRSLNPNFSITLDTIVIILLRSTQPIHF
jgi:hypothetical protein